MVLICFEVFKFWKKENRYILFEVGVHPLRLPEGAPALQERRACDPEHLLHLVERGAGNRQRRRLVKKMRFVEIFRNSLETYVRARNVLSEFRETFHRTHCRLKPMCRIFQTSSKGSPAG